MDGLKQVHGCATFNVQPVGVVIQLLTSAGF